MITAVLTAMTLAASASVLADEPLSLETRREPLNPEDRAQVRLGALEYRGGLSIRSENGRFGGLSGLLVEPEGSALLAVSDQGDWVSAALIHDPAGRLTGLGPARIGSLTGRNGGRLIGKRHQDAEALTRLADGSTLVAFERNHRVWRYPPSERPFGATPKEIPSPPDVGRLPANHSLEALVALGEDGFMVLPQDRNGQGLFPAFLRRAGRWQTLAYPASGGFEPSGATRLPGGDLLILERSYSAFGGLAVRLMRLDPAELDLSSGLRPRELGKLLSPLTLDNFEGVDSRLGPAGETLIYILSDDNFSPWQRTLLLQFALADGQ